MKRQEREGYSESLKSDTSEKCHEAAVVSIQAQPHERTHAQKKLNGYCIHTANCFICKLIKSYYCLTTWLSLKLFHTNTDFVVSAECISLAQRLSTWNSFTLTHWNENMRMPSVLFEFNKKKSEKWRLFVMTTKNCEKFIVQHSAFEKINVCRRENVNCWASVSTASLAAVATALIHICALSAGRVGGRSHSRN